MRPEFTKLKAARTILEQQGGGVDEAYADIRAIEQLIADKGVESDEEAAIAILLTRDSIRKSSVEYKMASAVMDFLTKKSAINIADIGGAYFGFE